jgi:hypothetical protein
MQAAYFSKTFINCQRNYTVKKPEDHNICFSSSDLPMYSLVFQVTSYFVLFDFLFLPCVLHAQLICGPSLNRTGVLLWLSRNQFISVIGRCYLKGYQWKIVSVDDFACSRSQNCNERALHVRCYCKSLVGLLDLISWILVTIIISWGKLVKFIEATELLVGKQWALIPAVTKEHLPLFCSILFFKPRIS